MHVLMLTNFGKQYSEKMTKSAIERVLCVYYPFLEVWLGYTYRLIDLRICAYQNIRLRFNKERQNI